MAFWPLEESASHHLGSSQGNLFFDPIFWPKCGLGSRVALGFIMVYHGSKGSPAYLRPPCKKQGGVRSTLPGVNVVAAPTSSMFLESSHLALSLTNPLTRRKPHISREHSTPKHSISIVAEFFTHRCFALHVCEPFLKGFQNIFKCHLTKYRQAPTQKI